MGPTIDEGYYLVGMKRPIREVFEKKIYGTGKVLEQTAEPLKEMGLTVGYVRKLQDMDDRERYYCLPEPYEIAEITKENIHRPLPYEKAEDLYYYTAI